MNDITIESLTSSEKLEHMDMFQVSDEVYSRSKELELTLLEALTLLVEEYDIDLNTITKYITFKLKEDLWLEATESNSIRGQKQDNRLC